MRSEADTEVTSRTNPDVDETREHLLQALWYSQRVVKYAYVKGVGAVPPSQPRQTRTGDPYFTDGYRAVVWLSSRPVALSEVEFVEWERPPTR